MNWEPKSPKTVVTPRGRLLAGAVAAALTVPSVLLDSAVLFALAGFVALLLFRQLRVRAAPMLLCLLTGCVSVTTRPALERIQARPLGFAARLVEGNVKALPSAVAAAMDPASDVSFRYTERAHQADNEVPVVLVLILSPVYLMGVPTGSYSVTAFAELAVSRGSREIARYQAEAKVSRLYGLYYGSTLRDLEDQARAQVRVAINDALYRNAEQLATATRMP